MKLTRIIGIAVAALSLALAVAPKAQAAIAFQSVPNLFDASKIATYGWCSPCGSSSYGPVTDLISIGSTSNITGMDLSIYTGGAYFPTDVTLMISTVAPGNVAGTLLFSQAISAADFTFAGSFSSTGGVIHTDSITGLTLAAGNYIIGFYDSSNLAINGYTGGTGFLYQGGVGQHSGQSVGVVLYSTDVPAPGALALLGLGLLGIGGMRRKAKAA